jgi:hypothetical protein
MTGFVLLNFNHNFLLQSGGHVLNKNREEKLLLIKIIMIIISQNMI